MSKPRDDRHKELFRPVLEEIIDLDGVSHGRTEAIEPDKCQPVRIGQPQAPRRLAL